MSQKFKKKIATLICFVVTVWRKQKVDLKPLYKNQDGLKAEDNDGNFIREINQNSFWARQGWISCNRLFNDSSLKLNRMTKDHSESISFKNRDM